MNFTDPDWLKLFIGGLIVAVICLLPVFVFKIFDVTKPQGSLLAVAGIFGAFIAFVSFVTMLFLKKY